MFSVFDAITVTGNGSAPGGPRATTWAATLSNATSVVNRTGRHVINLEGISSVAVDSTAAARPAQPPALQATPLSFAVDQILSLVLDADSHDTLIGDLAFEQVSWGMQRTKPSGGMRTMN